MKYELFSYRFAKEILQHEKYKLAWDEIIGVVEDCPLYLYRDKSKKK